MINRSALVGVVGILAGLGSFAACGSGQNSGMSVSPSSNPANVTLDLQDGNGNHIGSCSGTLVSPTAVLTAGHCVVAAHGWSIQTADGQTAHGALWWSTWRNFDSDLSHPAHSDVAMLLLDRPLFIQTYPTIASSVADDGTKLARLRRTNPSSLDPTQFQAIQSPVTSGVDMGFPLTYTMQPAPMEGDTDTGGAVIDPSSNTIYGVVSSRGLETGTVYVERVEYLRDWILGVASCSPPPMQTQCHPSSSSGGSGSGSGSSGSGSGGSGSGSGGTNSSGSGSGGSGSSGGTGSGSGGYGGSSGAGSGSSGAGSGSGGWSSSGTSSGSGGWSSSGGGDSDGGTCNPPPPPPPPPMNGYDGGCYSGSSGGSGGGVSSGGSGGGSGSGSGSGGGSGSGSGGVSGPDGGIVVLVPDGPGCVGFTCGGCGVDPNCQDGQQDYGGCGCTGGSSGFEAGPTQ